MFDTKDLILSVQQNNGTLFDKQINDFNNIIINCLTDCASNGQDNVDMFMKLKKMVHMDYDVCVEFGAAIKSKSKNIVNYMNTIYCDNKKLNDVLLNLYKSGDLESDFLRTILNNFHKCCYPNPAFVDQIYNNKDYDLVELLIESKRCVGNSTATMIIKDNNEKLVDLLIRMVNSNSNYYKSVIDITEIMYAHNKELLKRTHFRPSMKVISNICRNNDIDMIDYYEENNINLYLDCHFLEVLEIICETGHVKLLEKINIAEFNFFSTTHSKLFDKAQNNNYIDVMTQLIKFGMKPPQWQIYNFKPIALYIVLANYDDVQNNIHIDPNTLFNLSSQNSNYIKFLKINKQIIDQYYNNTLWAPKHHHLFSNKRRATVYILMMIIKRMQQMMTHIIPKPVVWIIINMFVFDI